MAHPTPYPTGTVTFLFTDVEGSTQRWQQQREAMARAVAQHDALLRQAIEEWGGYVFKTVGDAFCAAFAHAEDAVAAALAGQRALAAGDWGEAGPLRARMALHAGHAEERDADYFGLTVNRVARLLSAGHGGQVLLSLAAAELVHDGLPAGVALRDMGEYRLKDLERPERVFQLLAADLPADFPPLRTLDRQRHNLPVQLTPFVGREREVAQIEAILGEPGVRLVTLTGPGGTGKTRLSLQAAADMFDDFSDGVWFVDLSAVTDPALVPAAVAQALGVREMPGRSVVGAIADHLRLMRALLVLDNCEQVLPAAPLLGEALRECPSVKVLATSRAPLRVSGEREVPIPPLGLPEATDGAPVADVLRSEAVRLFVERAQGVRPTFALTEENAPAVARICLRLDGLPLAIELAAARTKHLPPAALLARLDSRLQLLAGGARDLPARQQTMRAAIAWSHDLLAPEEQALFRRLSVFAGGFTLEAAEAVVGRGMGVMGYGDDGSDSPLITHHPVPDVFDGLAALVDHSLVRQEEVGGEPRFAMLETIREFALEQLAAGGEEGAIRRAHADHFLRLAEAAEPAMWGPAQGPWLARLEAEHDNLRAALELLTETGGEAERALRLAGALWQFWRIRGHSTEGRARLAAVLERPGVDRASAAWAAATTGAGELAHIQGDSAGAVRLHGAAVAAWRALQDPGGLCPALWFLGYALLGEDHGRAGAVFEESLAVCRGAAAGRPEYRAQALAGASVWGLAHVARLSGDYGQAAALLEEVLAQTRDLGRPHSVAMTLQGLGDVARELGDDGRAAVRFREALELGWQLRDHAIVAGCLERLAEAASRRAQPGQGARLLGAAEVLREAGGAPDFSMDRALHERAVASARDQLDEAAFRKAWAAGRALSPEAAVADGLAVAAEVVGDP